MAPKDKDPITKERGIICRYKCYRVEFDNEYIGLSSRAFGERFREHLKTPSPIYDHFNITSHSTTIDNFSIVGREDQNLIRAIKEAIYIRVNNPSLNKNIGKYHLPHIWDENVPTITMVITSTIAKGNITPTPDPIVLEIVKVNIFLRPEEAMLETWWIFFLFLGGNWTCFS